MACQECDGACYGCTNNCQANCAVACFGECTSCTGNCNGCSGCGGACSSNCSGCTGTCKSDCNNACTSASASETIAQLGSNIALGNTIKVNDFISLRNAIHNELSRRGRTIPNDTYTENPALNVKVSVEHQQKIFDDLKVMDVTKFKTIGTEATKANTYTDAITYIKTLMAQNIK